MRSLHIYPNKIQELSDTRQKKTDFSEALFK